jgi:polysaccharide biosynthesis/export protein
MKTARKVRSRRALRVWRISTAAAVFLGTVWPAYAQQQKEPAALAATQPASGTPSAGGEADDQALQRRDSRYRLTAGDTFSLTFPFTPEFNQVVTVQPDGFVTLTAVGDFHVAGKTVPELRELLKANYQKILHDPVIDIVLKDFEKPYFIAAGEVARPGKYDLRGDTTLTEAIAIAGGFSETSKHSHVLLFHRVPDGWARAKVINVKKLFETNNLNEDVHLEPGDLFFVPQNRISKIKKWIPYTSLSAGAIPPL